MKHILCLFLFVVLLTGCGEKKVPPEFPTKLTSINVTLLKDGKPIDEAAISLISESQTPYLISAMTNASGVAKLETTVNTYSQIGVPPGIYKVLIMKQMKTTIPDPPPDKQSSMSETEMRDLQMRQDKERAELQKQSGISLDWNNLKKTPFQLTIPDSGKSFTIDVSDTKTFVQ
ncbi:MAG: carboxypeptidase-like regulatory domain-containing protein [Planctomycetaceae bacterium]|jgi:hypothetical protein|nr:carboxypeptidase-like regulatory domain-containing protein [Planctomycetaceae bacterium]